MATTRSQKLPQSTSSRGGGRGGNRRGRGGRGRGRGRLNFDNANLVADIGDTNSRSNSVLPENNLAIVPVQVAPMAEPVNPSSDATMADSVPEPPSETPVTETDQGAGVNQSAGNAERTEASEPQPESASAPPQGNVSEDPSNIDIDMAFVDDVVQNITGDILGTAADNVGTSGGIAGGSGVGNTQAETGRTEPVRGNVQTSQGNASGSENEDGADPDLQPVQTPLEPQGASENVSAGATRSGVRRRRSPNPRAEQNQPRRKRRKGKSPAVADDGVPISASMSFNARFYYSTQAEYYDSILRFRKFNVEITFGRRRAEELNWMRYLESKGLDKWATSMKTYHPKLVKEFYANLMPDVLDKHNPWFKICFLRGQIIEVKPKVFSELLGFPVSRIRGVYKGSVEFAEKHVVRTLTKGKLDSVGPKGLGSGNLTQKFFLLYKFCAHNVLPTANHSLVSKDMCNLLFAIDQGIEINYGWLVVEVMANHAHIFKTGDTSLLPYPALISAYLTSLGIKAGSRDSLERTNEFQMSSRLSAKRQDLPGPDGVPPPHSAITMARNALLRGSERFRELMGELMREQEYIDRALELLPDYWSDEEDVPTASSDSEDDLVDSDAADGADGPSD